MEQEKWNPYKSSPSEIFQFKPGISKFLRTPGCLSGCIYLLLLLTWIPTILLLLLSSSDYMKSITTLDIDAIGGAGLIISTTSLIISPFFFLLWQYRAYINLLALKNNCKFSRRAILIYSILPGPNLIVPFIGVREIRTFCRKFLSNSKPGLINPIFNKIPAVTILQISVFLFSINVFILFFPFYDNWNNDYGPFFIVVFFVSFVIGYPSAIIAVSSILRYFWNMMDVEKRNDRP